MATQARARTNDDLASRLFPPPALTPALASPLSDADAAIPPFPGAPLRGGPLFGVPSRARPGRAPAAPPPAPPRRGRSRQTPRGRPPGGFGAPHSAPPPPSPLWPPPGPLPRRPPVSRPSR